MSRRTKGASEWQGKVIAAEAAIPRSGWLANHSKQSSKCAKAIATLLFFALLAWPNKFLTQQRCHLPAPPLLHRGANCTMVGQVKLQGPHRVGAGAQQWLQKACERATECKPTVKGARGNPCGSINRSHLPNIQHWSIQEQQLPPGAQIR